MDPLASDSRPHGLSLRCGKALGEAVHGVMETLSPSLQPVSCCGNEPSHILY